MGKPMIDPGDEDFETILICAERYACGRQTYMPGIVIGFISPLIPYLSDRALYVLDQDMSTARHNNDCGDPTIDLPGWIGFHKLVRAERLRRGAEVDPNKWDLF